MKGSELIMYTLKLCSNFKKTKKKSPKTILGKEKRKSIFGCQLFSSPPIIFYLAVLDMSRRKDFPVMFCW